MQTMWGRVGLGIAIGLAIGILIGSSFNCQSQTPQLLPGSPTIQHDTLKMGKITFDTLRKVSYRIDTLVIHDTIVFTDTIKARYEGSQLTQINPGPPKPFSIPNAVLQAAPTILASFKAQEPKQIVELYAHADHDLLMGGYGGGFALELNLERLRLTPVTLFLDLGYDHSFHFEVGGRGKIAGLW